MQERVAVGLVVAAVLAALGARLPAGPSDPAAGGASRTEGETMPGLQTAVLAGGCFWCVEAVFEQVAGVEEAVSGYTGGHLEDPTYEQVCTGETGHAEAVKVTFDPSAISYEEILLVFFGTHDPTTKDRQGADAGPQYRSAIFPADPEQKRAAEAVIARLTKEKAFPRPIVTELASLRTFYPAEVSHQEYYARNSGQPYCRLVIAPKLEKLRKEFADKLAAPGRSAD